MSVDLASIDFFNGLPKQVIDQIRLRTTEQSFLSGEILIREGDAPNALFIVLSGRFRVSVAQRDTRYPEIGPGRPIGEIGFFAGGTRTATVTAIRDCMVLRLTKSDFLAVCAQHPKIWHKLVANLATRLASTTKGESANIQDSPRTIVVCPAGTAPISPSFYEHFETVFSQQKSSKFICSRDCIERFGKRVDFNCAELTVWLNKMEQQYQTVYFFTDSEMTDWSAKVIRHADHVIYVGMLDQHEAGQQIELNPMEHMANSLHPQEARRLVLLHHNTSESNQSWRWMDNRSLRMHHHIALHNLKDYRRLSRFVTGNAIGLVASGGGAFTAAHIGIYRALQEAGIEFDIMGGTSGGGAMAAAFAMGTDTHTISQFIEEIFVENKAFRTLTWPKFSVLDHTVFDQQLREKYSTRDIRDLWINFYALSVNLYSGEKHLHRSGPIWEAVRATSSIPGLLPPVITKDKKVLIDGGVIDNIPLESMNQLKTGPNIALCFASQYSNEVNHRYSSLPGRRELLTKMLNPFSKAKLPDAPSAGTVLLRSMVLNNESFNETLNARDIQFSTIIPDDIGLIDWHRHRSISEHAYEYGCKQIENLHKNADPAFMNILSLLRT